MDVAIPAVLDEAAVALSSSTDDFDFISMSEVNSGWSSPSALSPSNSVSGISGVRSGTPSSRSPTRATSSAARGLSPDGSFEGSRAYSSPSRRNSVTPGTSRLVSSGSTQATPLPLGSASYEPTTTFSPFVQHLSEALNASTLSPSPSPSASGASQLPFPTPPTPNDSFILAGAPFLPSLSNSLNHSQQSEIGGLVPNGGMNEGRRLSFTSYADILNEERLAELLGSPLGSGGIPGV